MSKTDLIIERFSELADEYDSAVLQSSYRGPQVLYDALLSCELMTDSFDILDLGCGTGLVGKIFKSCSKRLDGVELSTAMIAKARELEIYSNLAAADILTFCNQTASAYDVVISCGAFNISSRRSCSLT